MEEINAGCQKSTNKQKIKIQILRIRGKKQTRWREKRLEVMFDARERSEKAKARGTEANEEGEWLFLKRFRKEKVLVVFVGKLSF